MTQSIPPAPNAPLGRRLVLGTTAFEYDGRAYPYGLVRHVEFRQATHRVRGHDGRDKAVYESRLRVKIAPQGRKRGRWMVIRLVRWFFATQKTEDAAAHAAMVQAYEGLAARSFDARMDALMRGFAERRYITWGHYQLCANGELYRHFAYCMNLRDRDVNCLLFPDKLVCRKRPEAWWKRLLWSMVNAGEEIDLTRDRDCFLYFMRKETGLFWGSEKLRLWHGKAADGSSETPKAAPRQQEAKGGSVPPPPPPPEPRPMATSAQHLATLGLGKEATWDEVRAAYRALARKHHPDLMRGRGAGAADIRKAEEALKGINQAYGWLEDFYRLKPKT